MSDWLSPWQMRGSGKSKEDYAKEWARCAEKHANKMKHPVASNTHGAACLEPGCPWVKGYPQDGEII